MADLKISQLTDGGNAQAADEFVVARSGSNFRIDGASVAAAATSVGTLTSLTVSGAASIATGVASQLAVFGANNTTDKYITVKNSGGDLYLGSSATSTYLWNVANTPLQFFTNNAETMRLDASGNLGLGVTPSAWSTGKAMQFNSLNSLAIHGYSTGFELYNNAYYDSTSKYATNAVAASYQIQGNEHRWKVAPSGTAGNAITFTQAMTLDASGNLGVGAAAPAGYRGYFEGSSGTPTVGVRNTAGTSRFALGNSSGSVRATISVSDAELMLIGSEGNFPVAFQTNGNERARITSGGWSKFADNGTYVNSAGDYHEFSRSATSTTPVIIVWNKLTTSDNSFIQFGTEGSYTSRGDITYNRGAGQVAYNVTSDERLKENIADAEDAGAMVDAMQVRQFDWKETGNHLDYGFVAQELHAVVPHAVTVPEDEDKFWSVDYSKLVPMLVKEIQSLRARVAALEA